MLDDGRIYRSGDLSKASAIKALFAQSEEILGFWTEHYRDCLDKDVRDLVAAILADAKANGLRASHLQSLKSFAVPSNFLSPNTLPDGVNFIG